MDFLMEIEKQKRQTNKKDNEYFFNHFRRFLKTIILSLCSHTTAHQCFSNNSQLTDAGRMLRRFSGAAGQCRYVHVIQCWAEFLILTEYRIYSGSENTPNTEYRKYSGFENGLFAKFEYYSEFKK